MCGRAGGDPPRRLDCDASPRRSAGASEDASACVLGMTKGAGAPAQPELPFLLPPPSKDREGSSEQMLRRHKGTVQKPPPGEAPSQTRRKEGGGVFFSLFFFLLSPREREDFPAWRDRQSGFPV